MAINKAKVRAAAPYVLFGVGIVSFGGCIATTVRATKKILVLKDEYDGKLSDAKKAYEDSKAAAEKDDNKELPDILYRNYKKEKRSIMLSFVGRAAAYAAPAVGLGGTAMAAFGGSFGMMRESYLGASASLYALSETFNAYRGRTIEKYGADVDEELMYGYSRETETIEEVDPDTGKKKKAKRETFVGEPDGIFARRWKKWDYEDGSGTKEWDESPDYSWKYITTIIGQYQKKLNDGNYVTFKELLTELDLQTKAVGKVLTPEIKRRLYIESTSGWGPGDEIRCGLECDGDRSIPSKEAIAFLTGMSQDVTLIFNPRFDIFGQGVWEEKPLTIGCDGDEVIFSDVKEADHE